MINLKDTVKALNTDPDALRKGLRINGELHKNYKLYTSIDRALAVLVTGEIFLTNGGSWNDIDDHGLMDKNNAFGICLSCSTSENIAMWMLYGEKSGQRGAMLDFPGSVMKEILRCETLELGRFNKWGTFEAKHTLEKPNFDIFLTDVLYYDECNKGRVRLTLGEQHDVADRTVLEGKEIFSKKFGWSYEKECRLTARLSDEMMKVSKDEELYAVRAVLSQKARRIMNQDRLYRSPVFKGGVSVGKQSALTGRIDWEIK